MKTYVISRNEFPGRSFPLAQVNGPRYAALDDAMAVVRRYNEMFPGTGHSASDTDWYEISIMGKRGTDQEFEHLFFGHVLDWVDGYLPDGEYEAFNCRDLREPAKCYEVVNGKLCYRAK